MTLSSKSKFSRRTFLGGAGAALAVTTAQAAVNPLMGSRPLEVAVLLDGEGAFEGLRSTLGLKEIVPRIIIASSSAGSEKARRLHPEGVTVCSLRALVSVGRPLSGSVDAALIFGPWRTSDATLMPLLREDLPVYVDDPALATVLAATIPTRQLPKCSSVGLMSHFDPVVEVAGERLRSGLMGAVRDVALVRRGQNPILALEAAATLDVLSSMFGKLDVRRVATRNAQSSIDIRCERGQLQVPICSLNERNQAIPIRLQHFAYLVRNEASPSVSLRDVPRLSRWIW